MKHFFITLFIFTTVIMTTQGQEKVGFALSGGGALGYAHVGVLQAFSEVGIYPDAIAGASMGALIGSLYAAGYNSDYVLDLVKRDKLYRVNKLITLQNAFTNTGMSGHRVLYEVLPEAFGTDSFEGLKMPFYLSVTDIKNARSVIKSEGGNLVDYVIASTSIPGVFETVLINNIEYVDGGVLNNLPAEPLKDVVDVIIGVDVLPLHPKDLPANSFGYMIEALRIMQHQNSQGGRDVCEYIIEPRAIDEYNEFSFDKYREIYQYGYQAAKEYIAKNPEMVKRLSKKKK